MDDFRPQIVGGIEIEITGLDTAVPGGRGEAQVIPGAGADEQGRGAAFIAVRAAMRLAQQARRNPRHAILAGFTLPEQLAATVVADLQMGPGHRFGLVQRRHPDHGTLAAPFEMHAEIGHQRGGGHIAGAMVAEQRGSQPGTAEFHHIEARIGQGYADHLEFLLA